MKLNYKIATLAFSCAVTFSSCADFLDEKPYGQFTSDQIDDTSIEGLMAAAYAGLEAHFFGNNESFTAPVSNWVFVRMMPIKEEVVSAWRRLFINWKYPT